MKTITAFKSASGLITDDKKTAEADEKSFLLKKSVEDFVDEKAWSGMTKRDIVDLILENFDELKRM